MTSDTTVVALRQPEAVEDPLTAVLRSGARRLLAQAVEAEAEAFLAEMRGQRLSDGRERLVRHGYGPERLVQTGIGAVPVQRVKLRDRGAGPEGERIRFTSAILPRWARRTPSLDALLPVLYLRGVSMGDFQEALAALLGKEAPNLSPAVIARLRDTWQADYARWQRRDLAARHYVYLWADGIYLQARMEPQAECMLVLIGATPEGKKELVGFLNRPGFAGGRFAWVMPPWRDPQAEHSSAPRPRQVGCCRSARGGADCCTSPPTPGWRTRPPPDCAMGRAGGSPRL